MTKKEIFLKTNKLSELLNLALDDLELVENDDDYAINMKTWHYQDKESDPCEVCLAGSVLAKTFNVSKTYNFNSSDVSIGQETMPKLYAIDCIREGDLKTALWYLNIGKAKEDRILFDDTRTVLGETKNFKVIKRCRNSVKFITFYRGIASKLNMVGL